MTLTVTEDGIEVPEKYRDANKVVIRTPTSTMDMSSGFPMMVTDGHFPLVTSNDFGEDGDENESLAPNQVSFKQYGEEAEVFEVEV